MKKYTIKEIEEYIESQDSLGDVLYNLKNIDKYINTIYTDVQKNQLEDFLLQLEDYEGIKFTYNGITYEVPEINGVADYIDEYGLEHFSHLELTIEEFLELGLIEEV